jgi:predicted PurR-regulated permease PerM
MNKQESGFGASVIVLIVLVVAVIGLVGYKVVDSSRTKDTKEVTKKTQTVDNPVINSTQDLDKTSEELNLQDIDAELDTTDIDAALSN